MCSRFKQLIYYYKFYITHYASRQIRSVIVLEDEYNVFKRVIKSTI